MTAPVVSVVETDGHTEKAEQQVTEIVAREDPAARLKGKEHDTAGRHDVHVPSRAVTFGCA